MKSTFRRSILVLLASLLVLIGLFELHLFISIPESTIAADGTSSSQFQGFKQFNIHSTDNHQTSYPSHASDQPEETSFPSQSSHQSEDTSSSTGAFVEAFGSTNPWSIGDVLNRCHEFSPVSDRSSSANNGKKLKVIVLNSGFANSASKASVGASMGELTYWKEVLFALCLIDAERTFLTDERDMLDWISRDRQAISLGSPRLFDILLTDVYSFVSIQKVDAFHDWMAEAGGKCRLRILDDWGTPNRQNHAQLHLQQYLVPWSCAGTASQDIESINNKPPLSINGNFLLGHFVLPVRSHNRKKKLQAMVWGKEQGYFQPDPIVKLLQSIAKRVPLIMTARYKAEAFLDSTNITNLGIVSQAERERLLDESLFLIGVGDPVVGLTPFEALSHGVVYLNPVYYKVKHFWMNPTCDYGNQHPATMRLHPPQVHHYHLAQTMRPDQMLHEVQLIIDEIVANFEQGKHIEPFIDPFLTLEQYVSRLNESLRAEHICSG